jgi:uncharacterized membrane protein YgdD (TMEM256/DUF423 family)
MKGKFYTQTALIICAFGILLGAFGAHFLKEIIQASDLEVYDTAVKYQLFIGLGILTLSINHRHFNYKLANGLKMLLTGIILFSCSLYILACSSLMPNLYLKSIGMITPIGGVLLILGFLYIAFFCTAKLEETEKVSTPSKKQRKSE